MIQTIKNLSKKLLSDSWYTLNKYTFDFQRANGQWEQHQREVYDRGNGATVLLYNATKQKVVLTRQFRLPKIGRASCRERV